MKPDKIILWLADTQFSGMDSLPAELFGLQERGLTIRFCSDLKSHKKIFLCYARISERYSYFGR